MPELPEIETVKLQLAQVLPGKIITGVEVIKSKSFHGKPEIIIGKKVERVERKGKLLLIDLQGNVSLAVHLKMTGQLIYVDKKIRIAGGHPTKDFMGELPSKHTRMIFKLEGPPSHKASEGQGGKLYFNDQRMFGWVKADSKLNIENLPFIKKLGPEPFEINKDKFFKLLSKLKRPIKLALMDQTVISGVGNIYANDALWEAGIHPDTGCARLTEIQLDSLFQAVKKVLREGIKYGGASTSDYVDATGNIGSYQDHFRVYKREGLPCLKCKTLIKKIKLGGRGTYFCPKCQK